MMDVRNMSQEDYMKQLVQPMLNDALELVKM